MSTHNYVINASLRTDVGKGASRRLRRAGKVPAVLYGGEREPVTLVLDHDTVFHDAEEEAFHSSILNLHLDDGRKQKVVLRDMQMHPTKPLLQHIDFMRVNENQTLTLTVPLHFVNESKSPAGKKGGVVISHQLTEVEIEALPKDLPEFIEVDLSAIDVNGTVMLSDVKLPEGVSLVAFSHGDEDHDTPVASAAFVGGGSEDSDTEEGDAEESAE